MDFSRFRAGLLNAKVRKAILILIWTATSLLSAAALVSPIATRPSAYVLSPGDVAPQDIQAPYSLSFPSEILTEQARQEAEQRVPALYLPADPAISRKQIEQLRTALNYISVVRLDAYSSDEEKISDLSNLTTIKIDADLARTILNLNEVRWQAIQNEALNVLEQIMRDSIREDQVNEAVRRIPSLISFSLPQEQAVIVNELVAPFIVPNSLFDREQTEAAKKKARESVQPVIRNYISGEIIVRRGQVITPMVWETLQQYGLIRSQTTHEDYISSLALVAVVTGFGILFFTRRSNEPGNNLKILKRLPSQVLIAALFLLFLYSAKLVIPNRTVVPYFFPLPAFGLTISILFNLEIGLILSLMLSILTGFGLTNALDLTIFYILTSFIGALTLGRGKRISAFIWAGIAIGLSGSAVILAYRLTSPYSDLIGLATLVAAAFVNGIASSSLGLLFQYIFSQFLGATTALQLLEISRPDHPLLQFILQNAPGSYQHSLQVAVLAEQAADKIGADSMLVRVGGLYHDAGKALNPSFFIENQIGGQLNTHDDLDPSESARIIIEHVNHGVMLARKYRLPNRIQDFIREHHGTLMTRYQYAKALELAGNDTSRVDSTKFRYPGPEPRSRETAILMLADGCQARVRAELPQTEEEIRSVVRKVIEYCEKEGQLDHTQLTMRDLSVITESFVSTLKNTYHPRIRYPEIAPATQPLSIEETAK
ncbi:protein containing domain HDIG [Anaerolinea thermolimosa]|nr:protein containing domain HDIG [Anaerolinea thermolimosa]